MDILVLNTDLDIVHVLDLYNSFIWTDRYHEAGDFELYTQVNEEILANVKQDYYLQRRGSDRVMIVEKLLIETNMEDGDTITITGRSLESILDRRIIWGQTTVSGNLQKGIKQLITESIISPKIADRKITNFVFKDSTDPAITTLTLNAQYTGDNLYDVIKSVCEENAIGFKVTLNDSKQFVFELYSGTDRSYDQSEVPYVVFSSKFDNATGSNYMESKSSLKTIALVGGEGEGADRKYQTVGRGLGLNRRELFVDAKDATSDINNEITEQFDFSAYPSKAYSLSSKAFVTDALFNGAIVDVSAHAGRMIRISIPQYTNASGAASGYGTVLLDASRNYVSTLQTWEKYSDSVSRGTLRDYEFLLPDNAKYLCTAMYSEKAVTDEVYYGDIEDFMCTIIKLADPEYMDQLVQRGNANLSENKEVVSFEGEIDTSLMYQYEKDFFEGDIVQIADEYGHEAKVRILEIVMSENESGSSVYPTFETLPLGILPRGYTELEYIQSTGTQYIRTNFEFAVGEAHMFKFVMDAQFLGKANGGAYPLWGSGNTYAGFYGDYGYCHFALAGSKLIKSNWPYDNERHTWTVDGPNSLAIIDGHHYTLANTGQVEMAEFFIFGWNASTAALSPSRCYSLRMEFDGSVVRDFVPCINPDGEIGLYDLMYQKFYGNSGTGVFIAGKKGEMIE